MDLNLLIALDALLEENSVAAAADRLHLSPPAMSRTLSRIRRATGDDILVRAGRTMTPTPRALELREETRDLVRRATAVLTPPRTLDLDALDRVFTIRSHDALACALAPPLTAAIGARAPGVRLRLLAEPSADVADLARGHTDLEIGATDPARPEIAAQTIGTDQMAAVFRAGHPLADGELTPERLAAASHVTVSRRGRLHGVIDDALAERGLSRRVVASLPTSSAALDLAARTDLVTTVAEQVCRPVWTQLGLLARPLPFPVPAVPVILAWHHRSDTDPAHAWLRTQVGQALRTILGTGQAVARPGRGELDPADVADVADVAALALTTSGHESRVYELSGPEPLTPADRVAILGQVLRRDLRFEAQTDEDARAEMSEPTPAGYVDAFFDFYADGSLDESKVLPAVPELTGRPPRPFSQWAAAHAGAFR